MKLTTSFLFFTSTLASAAAFAPSKSSTTTKLQQKTVLYSSNNGGDDKSQALPFAPRPPMLDGSMAGDVGFDPLGFASTQDALFNYREAEIKHGRLAMLVSFLGEGVAPFGRIHHHNFSQKSFLCLFHLTGRGGVAHRGAL